MPIENLEIVALTYDRLCYVCGKSTQQQPHPTKLDVAKLVESNLGWSINNFWLDSPIWTCQPQYTKYLNDIGRA